MVAAEICDVGDIMTLAELGRARYGCVAGSIWISASDLLLFDETGEESGLYIRRNTLLF